jgi:putative flippase GtrA
VRPKLNKQQVQRFGKYLVGGSIYFWVGYGVFALLYGGFGWWWLWAKVLGDGIGWTCGYLVQRFWAFRDRIHLSEMKHAGRYVFIEAIGFALDYAIVGGLNYVGITPYIGMFISAAFLTLWNYAWYYLWVFPDKKR